MDLEKIAGLVKILEESSLTQLTVKEGEMKISLSKLDNAPVVSGGFAMPPAGYAGRKCRRNGDSAGSNGGPGREYARDPCTRSTLGSACRIGHRAKLCFSTDDPATGRKSASGRNRNSSDCRRSRRPREQDI